MKTFRKATKRTVIKKKLKAAVPIKKTVDTNFMYENLPFNVETFNTIVTKNRVESVIGLLNSKLKDQKEPDGKRDFKCKNYKYILDVKSINQHNNPNKRVQLKLKHNLFSFEKSKIVLIVKDIPTNSNAESTIQFYNNLLEFKGIKGIFVLPFNKIRKLYNSLDFKKNLANLYDLFLCESSIVTHVTGYLGPSFKKPRCTLYSVRTKNPTQFINDIKRSLKRTSYKPYKKGTLISIPIGMEDQSQHKIAENFMLVVKKLKTLFPGSLANIRNMYIRIDAAENFSLPIYIGIAPMSNFDGESDIKKQKKNINNIKMIANDLYSKLHIKKGLNAKKCDRLCENLSETKLKRLHVIKDSNLPTMVQDVAITSDDDDLDKLCDSARNHKTAIVNLLSVLLMTRMVVNN